MFTKRLSIHPGLNVLQGLTWHQARTGQDEWVESLGSAKLGQSSQHNMVHEVDAARSGCMHDQVIFFLIFYFTIYSFIYFFFMINRCWSSWHNNAYKWMTDEINSGTTIHVVCPIQSIPCMLMPWRL